MTIHDPLPIKTFTITTYTALCSCGWGTDRYGRHDAEAALAAHIAEHAEMEPQK